MTKELDYLEELKEYIEYFTRLDYVEPIVRGEVHQKFKDIYWNKLPHLDAIEQALKRLEQIDKLQEQIGCPLDVLVKAFKKYVEWTTACDFGYDNIPDEYEKYKNDNKFKILTYDSGLIYIVIQETLKEDKSE